MLVKNYVVLERLEQKIGNRLMKIFLSSVSFLLLTNVTSASVFCNPVTNTNCKPVIEYLPIKQKDNATTALPVVIAYVHDFAKEISLKDNYLHIADLEDDLDGKVVNIFAEFTKDDKYLKFLRETGEVINILTLNYKVHLTRNYTSFPYNDFTYIYKGLILPSGSLIVLRRAETTDYDYPTVNISDLSLPKSLRIKKDTSIVVKRTGVDFWKDYLSYVKSTSNPLPPDEYFKKKWKKLPKVIRNVSLPPIYIVKNGQLFVMRGKTVYESKELTDDKLSRYKTLKDYSQKIDDKTTLTVNRGTPLSTVHQKIQEALDKAGKYDEKALFYLKVLADTLLSYDKRATLFFNFDAGYAYVVEPDGTHAYAIVYAGTPKVLQYKAENDPHYTQYGMNDPTKIYWNEPFRNSVVVPERIACLYYAGENCKRFKVYKPASQHPAKDETLRFYYWKWKKKVGVNRVIPNNDRMKVITAINRAIWSEDVNDSELTNLNTIYVKALKETIKKPLVLTSRSYADKNYVSARNSSNGNIVVLPKIPKTFQDIANATGKVLKKEGDFLIYFSSDAVTEVPNVNVKTNYIIRTDKNISKEDINNYMVKPKSNNFTENNTEPMFFLPYLNKAIKMKG